MLSYWLISKMDEGNKASMLCLITFVEVCILPDVVGDELIKSFLVHSFSVASCLFGVTMSARNSRDSSSRFRR